MKTTLIRESSTIVRLTVEASEDELAPATDRAFRRLAAEMKVPGFRKGKVPPKVIEARLGREAVREAALREAIPMLYAQAVVEENVDPISSPQIEVTSGAEDGGITFDAMIEVRPAISLPEYTGLVVSRPSSGVADTEVEEQLKRLQERFASLDTVPRGASKGDYVLMNLRTYVHDKTIEGATGSDLLYEVGSGGFAPELDAQLEGRRAGEIVKFNTTMPAEAGGEQAGREVSCEVLVKEVRVKVLPSLDDEFAKTASEYDTLDELRADLREKITELKRVVADGEVRSRVLETLVTAADFEVPSSLIEEEFAFRLQRFSDQLRSAGVEVDEYLQQTGQSEEQVEGDLRVQAERNVKAQLLLEEIGKAERLEASDEEVADEIRRHSEALRAEADELRKQLESKGRLDALRGDIIRRKALDFVTERADIKFEDPTDAPGAGMRQSEQPSGSEE